PADHPTEWKDMDDLESALYLAMLQAVRRYDPDNPKQCSLESYVTLHLRSRWKDFLRNQYRREQHCQRGKDAARALEERTKKSHWSAKAMCCRSSLPTNRRGSSNVKIFWRVWRTPPRRQAR